MEPDSDIKRSLQRCRLFFALDFSGVIKARSVTRMKVSVMLLNLCKPGDYTNDLFATSPFVEATRVMTVLDQINERWGRGTLRSASVPVDPDWDMRREMMSQSYTTRLDQLWSVDCR